MNSAGRGRNRTDRNGQLDLPSSDPVYIYLHFGSRTLSLFDRDFRLTVTTCKSSERSDGDISLETIDLLGEFEDLPRLERFIFMLVRSGIAEAVVTVTASLQGGSPVGRPGRNFDRGRLAKVSGSSVST